MNNLVAKESGIAAHIHGASCSITFDDFNIISAQVDLNNSSLSPDEHIDITNGNTIHLALTRTDRTNKTCVDAIANVQVVIATSSLVSGETFAISTSNGRTIKADGTMAAESPKTLYDTYSEVSINDNNMVLSGFVDHVQCLTSGSIQLQISGGMPRYNGQWNTGSTSLQIDQMSPGTYTVNVIDVNGLSRSLSLEVEGQYLPIYDLFGHEITCTEFIYPTVIDFIEHLPDGTHHAATAINTNAEVTIGHTLYLKAGHVIQLLPGFAIPNGSNINLDIETCDN